MNNKGIVGATITTGTNVATIANKLSMVNFINWKGNNSKIKVRGTRMIKNNKNEHTVSSFLMMIATLLYHATKWPLMIGIINRLDRSNHGS